MDFLKDFWQYMKERKKWWLIPLLVIFLLLGLPLPLPLPQLLGLLIVFSSGSALAPFIYTLF